LENQQHARRYFSDAFLLKLTDSIRDIGLLQPLVCTLADNGELQLAAGYLRVKAAILAGLEKVPVLVVAGRPNEISLIENMLREGLTAVEEAEAVYALKKEFGYNLENLSALLGKGKSTLSEILSVAKLPKVIRDDCRCNAEIPRDVLVIINRAESDEKKIELYEEYKTGLLSSDDLKKQSGRSNSGTREVFAFIVSFLDKLARFNPDKIGPSDIDRFVKELERAYVELEKLLGVLNKQH
jgi:ParB family transcriptional regulator, chromosome partitioning protein